ncbi:MAG: hypothetical protein ACXWN2_02195 [Candidatus Limnocylindrales bacterium]
MTDPTTPEAGEPETAPSEREGPAQPNGPDEPGSELPTGLAEPAPEEFEDEEAGQAETQREAATAGAPGAVRPGPETLPYVDDRASKIWVVLIVFVFVGIMAYGVFLGVGGVLTPLPTPSPTPTFTEAPSESPSTSPSGSTSASPSGSGASASPSSAPSASGNPSPSPAPSTTSPAASPTQSP